MFPHKELTERIIGLAIEVHRTLGPGLLESAYEECLCFQLIQAAIPHARTVALPVIHKNVRLDFCYQMDVVVDQTVVLEIKATDRIHPLHEAQLLTYLRLSHHPIGLILNFHTVVLKDGIRRLAL
jgi:GxxExxY protein